jgi:putative hydroxymethylpyrimidine transport system permease protein
MQIFSLLKMPTALPYFLTALRISVPWSVIGAAVAEWLGAQNGLGTYSRSCMMNLDAAGLLAPLVVLTAFALFLNWVLGLAERRLAGWQDMS